MGLLFAGPNGLRGYLVLHLFQFCSDGLRSDRINPRIELGGVGLDIALYAKLGCVVQAISGYRALSECPAVYMRGPFLKIAGREGETDIGTPGFNHPGDRLGHLVIWR